MILIFSFLAILASPNAEAQSKDPIKLGYIADVSGPMGPKIKHLTNGVTLAVKEINDAGGILGGRKVEVITYDPRHVPEEGVSAVRRAIYQDKVKAVIGFPDGSVALASIPVGLKAKVPTVNLMAMEDTLIRKPGEIGFMSSIIKNKQIAQTQSKFAEEVLKIKSIVALGPENAWLHTNFKEIRNFFGRPGSQVKVLDTIPYPIGGTDITPVILKAASYKPDLIWSFAWGVTDTIQVYKKLEEVGYKGYRMQCLGMFIPPVIEAAGKTIEGAYGVIPWEVQLTNPESEAFKKALIDAFGPQIMAETSDVTATGYMGTKSLLLAMNKAGSDSDLKAIDKAYFQVDWATPMGWKYELDKDGWLVWKELSISQVKDGKVHIVKKIPRF
jgi:branched-chain amino acid transport system substrate-binding protein